MGKYKFNKETLRFVEDKTGIKGWIVRIIKYVIVSILLALLYYFIISLVYSTDSEKKLENENEMLEQEYAKMQEKLKILDNTIANLQIRDREIYRDLFKAEPPKLSSTETENPFYKEIGTSSNEDIIYFTKDGVTKMNSQVNIIHNYFESINAELLEMGDKSLFIPSIVPIKDFSITQIGASVGKKVNPFYKTIVMHHGVDLLANAGTEVIAPASGTVVSVDKKDKGVGNTIVINHGNGYITKYKHLGDIIARQGQKIKQGDVIARVGVTGMSFGPHLHYEIVKDDENVDPVYYFFANMSPKRFRQMLTISANTGQSLD